MGKESPSRELGLRVSRKSCSQYAVNQTNAAQYYDKYIECEIYKHIYISYDLSNPSLAPHSFPRSNILHQVLATCVRSTYHPLPAIPLLFLTLALSRNIDILPGTAPLLAARVRLSHAGSAVRCIIHKRRWQIRPLQRSGVPSARLHRAVTMRPHVSGGISGPTSIPFQQQLP